jgi:hypothetical protein
MNARDAGNRLIGKIMQIGGPGFDATCKDCRRVSYAEALRLNIPLIEASRWRHSEGLAAFEYTCPEHSEGKPRFPWIERVDPVKLGELSLKGAFHIPSARAFLPKDDPDYLEAT